MTTGPRSSIIAAFAAAFLFALFAGVAQANTFTVNTTADNAPTGAECSGTSGDCSVRQAIDAANNNAGDDTILVPAGRYDRTIAPDGPDDNSTGDFNVAPNGAVTIQGQTGDPKDVIISAAGLDRVLEIDRGGSVTLTGVTLQDGFLDGSTNESDNGAGAGVLAGNIPEVTVSPAAAGDTTSLTLNSSRILKNVSISDCGGGIYGDQGSTITLNSSNVDNNSGQFCGGGIGYEGNGSILKLFDSTVSGNNLNSNSDCCGGSGGGGIYDGASVGPTTEKSNAPSTANETLHAERSTIDDNQNTDGDGGGILVDGSASDLNLTDSHVDNNFATEGGGGIFDNSEGDLNLSSSTVDSNSTGFGPAGGIWVLNNSLNVTDGSSVSSNFGYEAGGGICAAGVPVTIDGSNVNNNQSRQSEGGGIAQSEGCFEYVGIGSPTPVPRQSRTFSITVTNAHVDGNFASDYGGGISDEGGDATVSGSTVNGNEVRHYKGGGIYNDGADLTVTDSHVDQNTADEEQGGGIATDFESGALTITRTSVDRNSAGSNEFANNQGRGGGVYAHGQSVRNDESPGTQISDSSISKNHSYLSGGGLWDATGAQISNSTIANNVADGADEGHSGGGIFDHNDGMTLTNVTLAGNIANDGDGGGIYANDVDPTFTATVIADNQSNSDPTTSNCGGNTYTSNGDNVENNGGSDSSAVTDCQLDTTGANGDKIVGDPRLGPLQDNGGPTLTRALLDGSPAIDNETHNTCPPPDHDQRQAPRPIGGACDSGAYEAYGLADLSISKDASPSPVGTDSDLTYTLHVANNGPDKMLSVSVSDPVPSGTTFKSVNTDHGSCDNTVSCNLGALAPGDTATITIVVHTGSSAGTVTNTATVAANATNSATSSPTRNASVTPVAPKDPDTSNNSATVQTQVNAPNQPTKSQPGPTIQAGPQACLKTPPRTSISRNGLQAAANTLRFVGRSIDLRCLTGKSLGIKKVQIAIAFKAGSKCRFLHKDGSLGKARSCRKPKYLTARRGKVRNGKVPWTFRIRNLHLPTGNYIVTARGTDTNNDVEKKIRTYNRKTFRIR